jgi:hypothetical protein
VRIIDYTQEWLLHGGLGEETENGEPDEKRVRRLSRAASERDVECVPLRVGQAVAVFEER